MPNQTISLPTSAETRQKLEAAGYVVASRSPGFEEWSKGGFRFTLRDGLAPGIRPWAGTDYAFPLGLALEFASLVGISPTGYRLVPEDVAKQLIPWIINDAMTCEEYGRMSFPGDAEKWNERARIYHALVAALSGESPKKDSLSTVPSGEETGDAR